MSSPVDDLPGDKWYIGLACSIAKGMGPQALISRNRLAQWRKVPQLQHINSTLHPSSLLPLGNDAACKSPSADHQDTWHHSKPTLQPGLGINVMAACEELLTQHALSPLTFHWGPQQMLSILDICSRQHSKDQMCFRCPLWAHASGHFFGHGHHTGGSLPQNQSLSGNWSGLIRSPMSESNGQAAPSVP